MGDNTGVYRTLYWCMNEIGVDTLSTYYGISLSSATAFHFYALKLKYTYKKASYNSNAHSPSKHLYHYHLSPVNPLLPNCIYRASIKFL